MKYTVLATGGKQYKVAEGDIIEIEKIAASEGEQVTFDKILLHASDGVFKVGRPSLDDVVVTGKVLEQKKGDKIRVAKFKAKAKYRKVTGHRQLLTQVQIEKISAKSSKPAKDGPPGGEAGKTEESKRKTSTRKTAKS